MPSLLHFLALFLLPLSSLGLYSGDADFLETSGAELQIDAHAPDPKWRYMAKQLQRDVASVRDEQLEMDFRENLTDILRKDTPQLEVSDGCRTPGFSQTKCLRRIYAGLRVYRVYLSYIEKENLTAADLMDIQTRTTNLLHSIKEKVKLQLNDDGPHPILKDIFGNTAWTRKIGTHSVLYNFANFMADTSRAINYMKAPKNNGLSKHWQ